MPAGAIRCIHVEGSGCYGHNGADDVALDAALLARACPGRPVRLQWMRDDEFAWEPYGAGHGDEGQGRARAEGTHRRLAVRAVEQHALHAADVDRPAPTCWRPGISPSRRRWAAAPARRSRPAAATATRSRSTISRASGSCITSSRRCRSGSRRCARSAPTPTCSRSESFMDELAAAAECRSGRVPARAHEGSARPRRDRGGGREGRTGRRARRATARAAAASAFSKYKNLACYVACIAEVEVDRASGKVRVPRAWAAIDAGLIINPDGLISPDRGRHRPVGELDAEGGGEVRQERHHSRATGRAIRS